MRRLHDPEGGARVWARPSARRAATASWPAVLLRTCVLLTGRSGATNQRGANQICANLTRKQKTNGRSAAYPYKSNKCHKIPRLKIGILAKIPRLKIGILAKIPRHLSVHDRAARRAAATARPGGAVDRRGARRLARCFRNRALKRSSRIPSHQRCALSWAPSLSQYSFDAQSESVTFRMTVALGRKCVSS